MTTSMKSSIDFKFRAFLLELCNGRELTANDIQKAIKRDYADKEFTRQRIENLLKQFLKSNFISRTKIEPSEEDKCRCSYTTTKRGRLRAEYYKTQLQGDSQ